MTFPTPGGISPLTSQLTGTPSGLPVNWQNLPTTAASFQETVQVIQLNMGSAKAAQFQAWYTEAWHKDPKLTPNQAAAIWITAQTIGSGVAGTGAVLGQIPQAAAKGAENNPLNKVVPHITNPLDWLKYIADFFSRLTQANTWIRVAEFALGAGLIVVGVAHMAKGTQVGETAGKIARKAGLVAML